MQLGFSQLSEMLLDGHQLNCFFELEEHLNTRENYLWTLIPIRQDEQGLFEKYTRNWLCLSLSPKRRNLFTGWEKMFDALVSKYPQTVYYLGPNTRLLQSPFSESGVCKINQGNDELKEE